MEVIQNIIIMSELEDLESARQCLSSERRFEIIPAQSLHEAVGFLGIFPDVKCVVVFTDKINWKRDDSPRTLQEFLTPGGGGPLILWYGTATKVPFASEKVVQVAETPEIAQVLKKMQSLLFTSETTTEIKEKNESTTGAFGLQEGSSNDNDYFQISIDQLLTAEIAPADIFIKIGSKEAGVNKYLKRFKREDELQKDFLLKCKQKEIKDLFIRIEERGLVTQYFTRNLLQKIKTMDESHNENNSILEVVYHQLNAVHHKSEEDLKEAGLKEEVMALASETVTSMVKSLEKSESLVKNIRKIFANSTSLSYRQSYMTILTAYSMLKQFSWTQQTHYQTMVFCGLFHNVSLTSEKHLLIRTEEEFEQANLSPKDKQLVRSHAKLSAEIIQKKGFPGDSDLIILQHHGSDKGDGFPKHISDKTHRLAVVFMVAEAFATKLLRTGSKQIDAAQILKEIMSEYEGGQIPSTINALKKALIS